MSSELSNFKTELASAMGMEDAMASWVEGGRTGKNPGVQIMQQASDVADAINNYLKALANRASSSTENTYVKKPSA